MKKKLASKDFCGTGENHVKSRTSMTNAIRTQPVLDPSSSPPPISPLSQDSSEADVRRLREAEERLRDAMAELQARQRSAARGSHAELCDHADVSCVANAIGNLCQSFLLSYGVRVGIGILLRAFKLARGQSYSSLLDLKMLFEEVEKERDAIEFVMYAFIMRPETLPKSYREFIQKTGPVARPVYQAVRECCRGGPIDVASLSDYISSKNSAIDVNVEEFASIIPCSAIHPNTNCLAQNANAMSATFKKTFPLYFSLTFVPYVVLHLQKFMASPYRTSWHAIRDSVRSTSFLSAFVGIFQAFICAHRKVATKDHKLVYWFAGGVAALSVMLEKKPRRSELALYVLPRAGDSLWEILINRHLLPDIKNAEKQKLSDTVLASDVEIEQSKYGPFMDHMILIVVQEVNVKLSTREGFLHRENLRD
uniref:Transmembrane protein 135 N-terminal domain-containing protein n=1 Tax=Capsella rubella TaxID=81985 RepID=K4FWJ7_9BRAS|nr:hypothetical protein 34G24.16 [Capsella rubella]